MIFDDDSKETTVTTGGWMDMLQARPVKNEAAKQEERAGGDAVLISVSRKKPRFLVPPFSWVIRINRTHRFQLDRLGAWVWSLCDGNRRVEEIIDEFAARFALSFHEARVSVTSYVKDLTQRGALVLVVEQ